MQSFRILIVYSMFYNPPVSSLLQDMPPDFELNSFRFGFAFIPLCISLMVTKQEPKIAMSEMGMFACGALAYIAYNVLTYSHYVKFIPLGSFGAIINGFEIIGCIVMTLVFDR